jgi:hypothetical protein
MKINFEHIQAAHCETGVTRNLLRNIGMDKMTEPLTFGIGAGLFFVYIPLLKINSGPAIAFRTMPGDIFKKTCKSLGITVIRKKFNSKEQAKAMQLVARWEFIIYLTFQKNIAFISTHII